MFHFIVAWGDRGADNIEFRGDFPREFETHSSGGEGNDHLIGGSAQDVMFTGTDGSDYLEGRVEPGTFHAERVHEDGRIEHRGRVAPGSPTRKPKL